MALNASEFEPSAARAERLDARMRARLADSLDYVFEQAADRLGADSEAARRATAAIRREPQTPHAFGAYYDLVLALEDGEDEQARVFAAELLPPRAPSGFSIAAIDDRPAREAERYRRLFSNEVAEIYNPDDRLLGECRARLGAAFDLLDRGYPEMAEEIRVLLREIVVGAGPEDPRALTFDGASSFMLWGAVLLNARGQASVLDTAQALAHESGHNVLFGFSADGPLVDNPDEELFSSPLRADPRPMDGVLHATYVVARMHQTVARLLSSGVLDAEQSAAAARDLALHAANFGTGDAIVRNGARLTPVGREVMDACRAYMAS